jgi:predicted ATP-dependent endonuclease of OLD family
VENKEAKYIDKVEIKGLFGRYDVDWKLNPDVNILVGENGTGKSTILKVIYQLFTRELESNNQLNSIIESSTISVKENIHNSKNTFNGILNYEKHDQSVAKESIMSYGKFNPYDVNIKFISTFDNIFKVTDIDRKFNPNLNTELDFQLDEAILNYKDYQLNLSKKIINQNQKAKIVFKKRKLFIETINRLFSETDKILDENDNGILLINDSYKITTTQLSSGEKQLLVILLTVLCQEEKPSILLMDEPELSLHVSWQYELIKIIRELNPNCQLIIVTHSTSIFAKGWMDKFFFTTGVEGILHPINEKV